MERMTDLNLPALISTESIVQNEIDPEKTIADAKIASMRLEAIEVGLSGRLLILSKSITAFGFLAVLLTGVWFIYERIILAVTQTYALIGIGIFVAVSASGMYLYIKENQKQGFRYEARVMNREINSLLNEIEQIEERERKASS